MRVISFSDMYMCYTCRFTASTRKAILTHSVQYHISDKTFSLRKKFLDEKSGSISYMSVHFTLTLKGIQEHVRDGEIVQISIDPNKISFKRTHDNDGSNVEKRTVTHSSVDTEHCDIYAYLPGAIENMEKIGRKQDFISLLNSLKCGHLDNNIALHLLLEVARFYSKDDIRSNCGWQWKIFSRGAR